MKSDKIIKIKCGKLYDGIKAELQENMEILIEGEKIVAVGRNLSFPEGTEIIDLSDATVTPGMIDAHVHPQFFDWRDTYNDTIYYSDGWRALAVANTVKKSLAGGFTTIRSVGWFREDYALDVKRAVEKGYIEGARLIVAPHFMCTPGSHGDMTQIVSTNPHLADYLQSNYPGCGSGPDFFVNAVRREVKLGADFIKIMATGGFATPNDSPEDIQMNDQEFKAIIDTANELGIPTTAHAYAPNLIQKLVKFGITGIEHGALMDEETARMMEEHGTYLVPTFMPYEDAIHGDEASITKKSPEFQRKLKIYKERLVKGREVIINSKIKLGYGTDFVTVHNAYEHGWEYWAWLNNGMDPFRALAAATRINAEICEINDIVGTIEVGKLADISAWKRDLLKDPYALMDCAFVMKSGKVYPTECRLPEEVSKQES
ncbi:amidohydrolase family protein [Ureibacillus sp. FSL W8-0352]|uniref:amidohydrolase family protein n=1 Tax=Ureibacillus sp. FSL W8-0352 TaxID=2954596 RepID=UPI0030FC280C